MIDRKMAKKANVIMNLPAIIRFSDEIIGNADRSLLEEIICNLIRKVLGSFWYALDRRLILGGSICSNILITSN
ncbi:hypothetical protein PAECIP111802_03333 [Paenibacillus allorhizosphaerae]|uniref:Uncharacterized protein n=1 Tax=Paenibacillus allorhizosphaerae TaxID=2849866 RepID=A0ABM8VJ57_9BACL|nr:hypothetical protein PAECIP111802_03333 [Paenibacillus allorhizosphaerae]